MIFTFVDSPLWYLQWMEKERDLESPLKDQVLTLEVELRVMRTYLIYLTMAKGIPSESSSVINSVEAVFIDLTKDLSSACLRSPSAAGTAVCSMLEKVKGCKQEIRKDYAILWDQPWKSGSVPLCLAVKEFIDSILDNLKDILGSKCLVPILKENIESLKEKMSFIGRFISIIEERKVVHQKMGSFLTYVQVVATRAACLSYFCWFDERDETNASRMDIHFSDLMQLVKGCTSDCLDVCFEVLKASNDEVEGFVDFLLGKSAACIKDQIGTIREELMFLIKFSIELPGHCTDDLRQILADIKAVAKGTGLLLISKVKDDHFRETSILLSSFLQNMSIIKGKISKIRLKSFEEESDVAVPAKEETVALVKGRNFQTTFSVDLPEEEKKVDQGCKLTENLVIKVNHALFPLLRKIEVIRAGMYLEKQQNHRADLFYPLKDQIKSLQEDMACLESKFMVCESSSLVSSFGVNEMATDCADEVSLYLRKLNDIVKAELFLLELRYDELGLMVHLKDQAEKLGEGLRFLRIFLMNPPRNHYKENELMLTKGEAMASEVASVIFSFYENAMKENMAREMNLMVSEVLKKIMLLQVEIRKVYLQLPLSLHSDLPNGLIFISSLVGDIKKMVNYKADSIEFLKPHIEMLDAELISLKPFLLDTAEQHSEHEDLKDLWTCIADVAYEAEYMIDSSVFGDDPKWQFILWLPFAMERIKLIKSRIEEIYAKDMFNIGTHNVNHSLDQQSLMDYNLAAGEVVVGLEDEAEFMIDQLIRGSKCLDIVSIVGPPGLGKTSLAKKVYYNTSVARHFHLQVWYSASQEYRRRELFSTILHGIVNDVNLDRGMDDQDMADMLRRCLKGRRYLIVIDNLWHAEAWDDIRHSLPDDRNGSRVFLTSQLRHVALHANPYRDPYCLRPLSSEEGLELLLKKIFASEACPPVLSEAGKQISEKCKGIPLVLVLTAGLLARTEKTVDCWKQITKSSRSNFFVDVLVDVLELCYGLLPDHLKSCFLYFGAFPENTEISVPKLLRLWIAEGFIQENEFRPMKDIAEEYLAGLVARNLVAISRRSSRNGIKTCRISDLLRGFCIKKAEEENFLQRTHWSRLSNSLAFQKRRLCLGIGVGDVAERSIMSKLSTPCVRCLLCSIPSDMDSKLPDFVSLNLDKFRLLTVLDIESINVGNSFPTGLLLLELLRYLAVRGGVKSVPSSLANLWNLETLIVKGSRGVVEFPSSFWNMKKLKHVHILPRVIFNLGVDELDCSDLVLPDMFSLSTPVIPNQNFLNELLRRFPSLRKLKFVFLPSGNGLSKYYGFPTAAFDFLCHLESLNISPIQRKYYPREFSFPSNLKKLTLSKFGLPWSDMCVIGNLPQLEILKLLYRAFKGQLWEVEGEFLALKYLKLDFLDLVRWTGSWESFPVLEQLVIHRCRLIEEFPSMLAESPTLKMIEIQSCGHSAGNIAEHIRQEQQDMGNAAFKVIDDARRSGNQHYSRLDRLTFSDEEFFKDEEEDEEYDIEEDINEHDQ